MLNWVLHNIINIITVLAFIVGLISLVIAVITLINTNTLKKYLKQQKKRRYLYSNGSNLPLEIKACISKLSKGLPNDKALFFSLHTILGKLDAFKDALNEDGKKYLKEFNDLVHEDKNNYLMLIEKLTALCTCIEEEDSNGE